MEQSLFHRCLYWQSWHVIGVVSAATGLAAHVKLKKIIWRRKFYYCHTEKDFSGEKSFIFFFIFREIDGPSLEFPTSDPPRWLVFCPPPPASHWTPPWCPGWCPCGPWRCSWGQSSAALRDSRAGAGRVCTSLRDTRGGRREWAPHTSPAPKQFFFQILDLRNSNV